MTLAVLGAVAEAHSAVSVFDGSIGVDRDCAVSVAELILGHIVCVYLDNQKEKEP